MSQENIAQEETTPLNAADTMNGSAHAPETLWIGEDYRLVEQLGAGAMGTVWRARDERLGRMVALKLVPTSGLAQKDLDRVHREARLTASVEHANVVTVHDTGTTENGDFYMVMELLDGTDLHEVCLDSGQRSAEETVQLLLPILAGMKAAHRVNILHRDIKPANVFIAKVDGKLVPKLVDFGVALRSDMPNSHRLTQDGHLLGTPLYMAPEQLQGAANVDETTDIWSFSIVLYEALTGEAPFEGANLPALFLNILHQDLPALPAHVGDADLNYILQKGAAKSGADRWQSADEMAQALARWLAVRKVHVDISGDSLAKWLDDADQPISWHPTRRSARPALPSLAEWQRVASSGMRRIAAHGKRQLTLAVGVPLVIFGAQAWATMDPAVEDSVAQAATTSLPSSTHSPSEDRALKVRGLGNNLDRRLKAEQTQAQDESLESNESSDSSLVSPKKAPSFKPPRTAPSKEANAQNLNPTSAKQVDPYWGF